MKTLTEKLVSLAQSGDIQSFTLDKQIPSCSGDHKNRLIDKLTIKFNSGATLKLSTFCSGCLENTSLELDEG